MKDKILEIKKQLDECNIDTKNLVYVPQIPMLGIDKSYVVEEHFGLKVAKLISCEE